MSLSQMSEKIAKVVKLADENPGSYEALECLISVIDSVKLEIAKKISHILNNKNVGVESVEKESVDQYMSAIVNYDKDLANKIKASVLNDDTSVEIGIYELIDYLSLKFGE